MTTPTTRTPTTTGISRITGEDTTGAIAPSTAAGGASPTPAGICGAQPPGMAGSGSAWGWRGTITAARSSSTRGGEVSGITPGGGPPGGTIPVGTITTTPTGPGQDMLGWHTSPLLAEPSTPPRPTSDTGPPTSRNLRDVWPPPRLRPSPGGARMERPGPRPHPPRRAEPSLEPPVGTSAPLEWRFPTPAAALLLPERGLPPPVAAWPPPGPGTRTLRPDPAHRALRPPRTGAAPAPPAPAPRESLFPARVAAAAPPGPPALLVLRIGSAAVQGVRHGRPRPGHLRPALRRLPRPPPRRR